MTNEELQRILSERILVLDGSMGVMVQRLGLSEEDFRGDRFRDAAENLKGNNDILVLSNPQYISAIHRLYLEAGADIIETDTFNANRLSQAQYDCQSLVGEINREGARLARAEADRANAADPSRHRLVAGSIGPTGVSASLSADVNDPAARAIDFEELADIFREQAAGLIEGGVDLLLIETVFDALGAKAALEGVRRAMEQAGREIAVIVSATLSDASGRLLSGHSIEAFLTAIAHARPAAVGLNCSAGPEGLVAHLRRLSAIAPCPVAFYPNAGLPDQLGNYGATPEIFAAEIRKILSEGLVNIVGGCCGTTPDHIRLVAQAVASNPAPRAVPKPETSWLAGLDAFSDRMGFINVGERCNVAGSRKFLRLVGEGNWDEALSIARRQVQDGAMILDINMDDAMLDSRAMMVRFLRLLASDPLTAAVPWMIDSSDFSVIEAALQNVAGKAIVNSISLKAGEEEFLRQARTIRRYGAAVVVMAFDEKGQATTLERRKEIIARAYRLLTEKAGFAPRDIIFDPNILTVATGMAEHDRYAADFIATVRWVKETYPEAKTSGGVSNLSFAFRGNNYIRQALHAVFLYHAIEAGLTMAIVDPSSKVTYSDIQSELLEHLEDVVLYRRSDACDRLIEMAAQYAGQKIAEVSAATTELSADPDERLRQALRNGDESRLEADLEESLKLHGADAAAVVEGPLMDGMERVGELFGQGKMFLPQVVKSARVMHRAVEILRPRLEEGAGGGRSRGLFLTATVKGDVHDIGKNIVDVVMRCNNFEVVDLGVQVDATTIVEAAKRLSPTFIGLSGLISPSLGEMAVTVKALREAGITVPVFVGGAATSELHTAVKIAPEYGEGLVVRVGDASQNPVIASRLLSDYSTEYQRIREAQQALRVGPGEHNRCSCCHPAGVPAPSIDWSAEAKNIVAPSFIGQRRIETIGVEDIRQFINWTYFFNCWKVRPDSDEAVKVKADAQRLIDSLIADGATMEAVVAFYPASASDDTINVRTANGVEPIRVGRQRPKPGRTVCMSLADFVAPEGYEDYIGAFAVTIGPEIRRAIERARQSSDDYQLILLQSVADRLAEATSEWLHYKVRTRLWGYAPDEPLDLRAIRRGQYRGIRPAVGYPALPDQRLMFNLGRLVDLSSIAVTPTENGALDPASTVAGFYLASPRSRYFSL